jgi:hypothetical protein
MAPLRGPLILILTYVNINIIKGINFILLYVFKTYSTKSALYTTYLHVIQEVKFFYIAGQSPVSSVVYF